jgi:hypothetical protein
LKSEESFCLRILFYFFEKEGKSAADVNATYA